MATDAFETWMGFWTGKGAGQTSPVLEMQRQMLRAWTAPWMALGLPGFEMPEAARREAPRPAPRHAPQHPPQHAPALATAQPPAAREPAPPEDLPWSPGPAAAVAVMGAQASSQATPVPEAQHAKPQRAESATPARRPRQAPKASIPPRTAPSRKAARALPEERSPATSGRRIAKPSRKPTH